MRGGWASIAFNGGPREAIKYFPHLTLDIIPDRFWNSIWHNARSDCIWLFIWRICWHSILKTHPAFFERLAISCGILRGILFGIFSGLLSDLIVRPQSKPTKPVSRVKSGLSLTERASLGDLSAVCPPNFLAPPRAWTPKRGSILHKKVWSWIPNLPTSWCEKIGAGKKSAPWCYCSIQVGEPAAPPHQRVHIPLHQDAIKPRWASQHLAEQCKQTASDFPLKMPPLCPGAARTLA